MTVVQQREDGDPVVPPLQGEQFPFRLDIRDTNLVMYFQQGPDSWLPVGEGADLRLNDEGRSAIVLAAMQIGDPSETWMVNLTRWDEETLTVYLSQVISRKSESDEAPAAPPTTFGALGQMTRISTDG